MSPSRLKLSMFTFMRMLGYFFFISAVSVLFGCNHDNETSESSVPVNKKEKSTIQRGGTYKIPLDWNPVTLDPAYIEDDFGASVAYQLFDGLVQFGPYLSVLPALAKNWQVEDHGRIIRFFLRKNAYFHHGRAVTAQDVVFSLTRLFKMEPAPSILSHLLNLKGSKAYRNKTSPHISGLVVIDEQQLEMHLTEPYAPLLGALAMSQASIVPEDIVNQAGAAFGQSPVGCGPFKFVDWQSDLMIRLERYPEYYAGAAYLDTVEYHIYPGAQRSRVLTDFKSGQLQEMPVYGGVRQQLSEMKDLSWVHRPSLSLLFYGININHPQLKDHRLRRALALAINREELVETVYKGQFEAARSVLPPGMPAHNREEYSVEENLDEAKSLIKQILSTSPERTLAVEITSASESAYAQAEFSFIQKAWTEIGVNTTIRYITDWSEFEKYLKSGSMQMYRYNWTANMPDPDNFLQPLFGSHSPVNYTGYSNIEIDRLLKQGGGMIDPIGRSQLYQKIESQAMQSNPIIPLFYLSIDRVYLSSVQNVYVNALGPHTTKLHRVWLKSLVPYSRNTAIKK